MERATAIKKLRRILGASFGYRVDSSAPSSEERAAAKAELPSAVAAKKEAEEKMNARERAVLANDAEYQTLRAAWIAARDHSAALFSTSMHYKITVGNMLGIGFHVKAQGSTWEEIFEHLERK